MTRLTLGLGGLIFCGGLAVMGAGLAAPAKAWLGQHWLDQAWEETLTTGQPARPWSWSDFTPKARITVPKLDVQAVVLDQASGPAMAWGPGHVEGTAEPGGPGLAAFAGHRDTHLAFAAKMQVGDRMVVETRDGQRHIYQVSQALVVDSRTWRFPEQFEGPSHLVLATCWPFGAQVQGPMRFLLVTERVDPDTTTALADLGG